MVKPKAIKKLRNHLRDHRVFVAIANKKRIAENIAEVYKDKNDTFYKQTVEEIKY